MSIHPSITHCTSYPSRVTRPLEPIPADFRFEAGTLWAGTPMWNKANTEKNNYSFIHTTYVQKSDNPPSNSFNLIIATHVTYYIIMCL